MAGETFWSRNANFEDSDGAIQPIGNWSDQNLEGCFLLTGSLSRAVRNRARMKPNAQLSGIPAIGSNFLTFTSETCWLQTQISEASNMTVMAVANWPDSVGSTPKGVVASTLGANSVQQSGLSNGFNLSVYAGASSSASINASLDVEYWSGSTPSNVNATVNIAAPGTWRCLAAMFGAGGSEIVDLGTGDTITGSTTYVRDPDNLFVRIGSDYDGSQTGAVSLAMVMIWSRVLSAPEFVAVYGQMQTYCAFKGITV